MSEEEIAKVAGTQSRDFTRTDGSRPNGKPKTGRGIPITDEDAERAWKAVEEHGSQSAAAKALGIKRGALGYRLGVYMRRHGLKGPLPGASRATTPDEALAASDDKALPSRHELERLTVERPQPTVGEAINADFERAAERERARKAFGPSTRKADAPPAETSDADSEPAVVLVQHPSGEVYAKGYNQGYDDALEHEAGDVLAQQTLRPLIDWLGVYGPNWTQARAERWFKALTAAIDLVYPTRAGVNDARHPEAFCERCGQPNPVWFAPNEIWNAVMRDGREGTGNEAQWGVVCPSCFAELAAAAGVGDKNAWRFAPEVAA